MIVWSLRPQITGKRLFQGSKRDVAKVGIDDFSKKSCVVNIAVPLNFSLKECMTESKSGVPLLGHMAQKHSRKMCPCLPEDSRRWPGHEDDHAMPACD